MVQKVLHDGQIFAVQFDTLRLHSAEYVVGTLNPQHRRCITEAIARFTRFQHALNDESCHLVEPFWSMGTAKCKCCGKFVNPAKLGSWDGCSDRTQRAFSGAVACWLRKIAAYLSLLYDLKAQLAGIDGAISWDWERTLRAQAEDLRTFVDGDVLEFFTTQVKRKGTRGPRVVLRNALARWQSIRQTWERMDGHRVAMTDIRLKPFACLGCFKRPPDNAMLHHWLKGVCKKVRHDDSGGVGFRLVCEICTILFGSQCSIGYKSKSGCGAMSPVCYLPAAAMIRDCECLVALRSQKVFRDF